MPQITLFFVVKQEKSTYLSQNELNPLQIFVDIFLLAVKRNFRVS
jgi:hypothetical protein